jgi:hypothetical protein
MDYATTIRIGGSRQQPWVSAGLPRAAGVWLMNRN